MAKLPCEQVKEQLGAYIEGETDPEVTRLIEEHVQGCPLCQEEMTKTTVVMTNLRRERRARNREKSSINIWKDVEGQAQAVLRRNRMHFLLRILTITAGLCFLVGAYFFFSSLGEGKKEETRPPSGPMLSGAKEENDKSDGVSAKISFETSKSGTSKKTPLTLKDDKTGEP